MSKDFQIGVIAKQDSERRELHGIAYRAGVLDTAGDYMSVETLRKAAQEALSGGVKVDVNHSLKALAPEHASIAQSWFDETNAAWRVVVKFSDPAWSELVKSEKVKGFSVYGSAAGRRPGIAKDENDNDKPGKEILGAKISYVSLVAKPANRTQGPLPVAKSEAPKWAQALIDSNKKLVEKVEAQDARLAEIEASRATGKKATVTPLRKAQDEADADRTVEISRLEKRHAALSARLARLWENPGGESGGLSPRAAENDLVVALSKVENELEALRGEQSFGSDAFGGSSEYIDVGRVFPGGDSAFERDGKLKKGEEEIDLSSLKI